MESKLTEGDKVIISTAFYSGKFPSDLSSDLKGLDQELIHGKNCFTDKGLLLFFDDEASRWSEDVE